MRLSKGQNRYQNEVLSFAIHKLGWKNGPLPMDFIYKYLNKDIPKEKLLELYETYKNEHTILPRQES